MAYVPLVKARRAIGFACRATEAPLRRAERAASWAIEFMMTGDGIGDGGLSFAVEIVLVNKLRGE